MKLIFTIFISLLRTLLLKVRYPARYSSAWIERIEPSVSIKPYDKSKISIGYNVNLDKNVDISAHGLGNIHIGDRVYMNRYCMISCHSKVSIGDNCMFGPSVKIFDNNHRFTREKGVSASVSSEEIIIGKNCWIASNVIILKGANIGDNCVIGAGCIISSKIPANSIVKLTQALNVQEIH